MEANPIDDLHDVQGFIKLTYHDAKIDLDSARIANAAIGPEEHNGIIEEKMVGAGAAYLQRRVVALVEAEPEEFENTIRELFAVMSQTRRSILPVLSRRKR
jgi:hypothetical protein